MSIQSELFTVLSTIAPAYPVMLPQDFQDFPAIVVGFPGTIPINTACGDSEVDEWRVQIDIYHADYDLGLDMRRPVFNAVESALPSAERSIDSQQFEPDGRLFRFMIEYVIRHA